MNFFQKFLKLFLVLVALSTSLQAAPPRPEDLLPPAKNPHPPQSAADRRRVEFAENAARLILGSPPVSDPRSFRPPASEGFQDKDLACLRDYECYRKDAAFLQELQNLQGRYEPIREMRHAHIIPWSWEKFQKRGEAPAAPQAKMSGAQARMIPSAPLPKPDEYMVHVYVRLDLRGDSTNATAWYHLDVILTENAQGEVFLRHFYIAPLVPSLPPGVVC